MTKDINPKPFLYAIGGIAALMILKPILERIGLIKSAEEAQRESENRQQREEFVNPTRRDPKSTKTDGEWAIIADQIYEDLKYSAVSDNKEDAMYQAARAKNITDVKKLIRAFGTRQEYAFGIPTGNPKDLQQFLRSNLTSAQVGQINANYARKGINFSF